MHRGKSSLFAHPQYSDAATRSSIEKFLAEAKTAFPGVPLKTIDAFYAEPLFIAGFAQRLEKALRATAADHVLFSFHGLPERQIKRTCRGGVCLTHGGCCDAIRADNLNCYRAQSYATARMIAKKAGISKEKFTVGFQSRLGTTAWIKPYSDQVVQELAAQGVRNLVVCSPSFVADCLETVEEIAMRMRDTFIEAGGRELTLVPSLNSDPDWASAVALLAKSRARPLSLG